MDRERDTTPSATTGLERLLVWSPLEPRTSSPAGSPEAVRPLRILLAEDNAVDQLSIRRLLEKRGHTVVCASTGSEAMELFRQSRFDLVLMDILMPDQDGFETALHIRRAESGSPAVPIIALSAYALRAVSDKCRSVGMNGYLSKPVRNDDLDTLFRDLFRPPL